VVLDESMASAGTSDAVGRGATLARERCSMCHGPRGLSAADAPNLAGQYGDVIVKQLLDYQHDDRASAVMQSLSSQLTERDVRDLAAYFASLPKPRNAPVTDMSTVPQLVRTGAPMRNVAPCASCHGGIDRKLGAPWLEGMPRQYLVQQLTRFASGERHNDALAQMRNMARALTAQEIGDLSDFYARHGEGEGQP
jgi:cytochrome c553